MCSRALATVFIIYCLNSGFCEELFDLSCRSDADCEVFWRPRQNVTCFEEKCACESLENRQRVDCKPTDLRQNNVVGGHCPCHMENAFCNGTNKICLCNLEFVASFDRRRCIRESVPLGDLCEDNAQCIKNDRFSFCDPNKKACVCLEHFVEKESKCLSTVSLIESCDFDDQCENHTKNSICSGKKCVCKPEFIANNLKSACLPNAGHREECSETNQCKSKLGIGAVCDGGECACSSDYYALNVSTNGTQHVKCQRKPVPGDYCRENSDCVHAVLENTSVVECFSGYCRCSDGKTCSSGNSGYKIVISDSSIIFGYIFVILLMQFNFNFKLL